jgi:hypothetical protein
LAAQPIKIRARQNSNFATLFSNIAQARRLGATHIELSKWPKGERRMSRPLKTIVAPALAGSLLLMMGFTAAAAASRHHASSHHSRSAAMRSYNVVPNAPRSSRFEYRHGTSAYPFGPGANFPYPDRPYGDPDHW